MEFQNLKSISEIKCTEGEAEIAVPMRCDDNYRGEFEHLIFKDNGALILSGNGSIKANKITNLKNRHSLCDYEFIIEGKNGKDAASPRESGKNAKDAGELNISAVWISGNIRIKASAGNGGRGFDGIDGQNGGNGGDGYCGGDGGDGGDAEAGTDGGNGGNAPCVNIKYALIERRAAIYVNGKEVNRKGRLTLMGGKGGEGGSSAKGGKGGEGGKGLDEKHNGKRGRDGTDGEKGERGKSGKNGAVTVSRGSLEERLKNNRELYVFDLSDEEEREYCINRLGGIDAVKEKESVMRAIKRSSSDGGNSNTAISIRFIELSAISHDKGTFFFGSRENAEGKERSEEDFGKLKLTFSVDLYDNKTRINDEEAAKKWQFASVDINVINKSYSAGLPVINQSFEIRDSYGGVQAALSEPIQAKYMEGEFGGKVTVHGIDANGKYVGAEYPIYCHTEGNTINHKVQNIRVDHPHWDNTKKSYTESIVMVYGRTDQQPFYSEAEYRGGDYENNAIKTGNKIATLIPFSGSVTFDSSYEPVGLKPPGGGLPFVRPSLDYDNKASSDADADVSYQNDLTDSELYELMKNCFTAHNGQTKPYVDFDFAMDRGDNTSRLDWHHDIEGEGDNHKRTVKLRGDFVYRIHRKELPKDKTSDVTISVWSVTEEELERISKEGPKREYYKFLLGSNTLYIPIIYIFWGCFGEGDMLKASDGKTIPAESVKKGDTLLTHTGETVTVNNIFKGNDESIYRLKCTGGYETLLSGAHPVLCENGKGVSVRRLKAGDRVMTEGGSAEVISAEKEPYGGAVYNFTFEGRADSVYIISDGIYAGDFNAQNETAEEHRETEEERKERLKLTEEMSSLCRKASL